MKKLKHSIALAATVAALVLTAPMAQAQISAEAVNTLDARFQQVEAAYEKLAPAQQRALDGYANVLQFAKVWHQYGQRFAQQSFQSRLGLMMGAGFANRLPASFPSGVAPVSNPATDLLYSSFGGFTQSETSTALCGSNAVVGFNDSGSVFETPFFFTGLGGQSFSGVAVSSDGGSTFKDLGPVPPGSTTGNFLGGDPMVTCSDSSTFYYSQIFVTSNSSGAPVAAEAVNKSTDGGQTWGDPVAAVTKDGFTHFLDKPWSTIDPTDHNRIYVSYTDFDSSGTNPACPPVQGVAQARTAIEFVESDDGGSTWRRPKVAIQVCGSAAVQGSQLQVDSKGTLHILWDNLGNDFPISIRTIQASSFVPGGTVSAPVTVSTHIPGGDSYYLQGEYRDFLGVAMAVDRSRTTSDGTLYVVWGDGRDKVVPDPLATAGTYSYDDILVVSSADGGNTWTLPVKVNTDTQPRTAGGHDHYQPGVAVDQSGKVAVCWYDRRNDSENFAISHFCGESVAGGVPGTWTSTNVGVSPFAPTHGIDLFVNPIYLGDYDVVTSDFTGTNLGFIGSFQVTHNNRGNPDIVAYQFP